MTDKGASRSREVALAAEVVELCDLLKLEGLAQSGGEAKFVIAEGRVRVNGEVETRKRKKLRGGDVVQYAGQSLRIV